MPVDILKDLKKYVPIFQQAHDQSINEAETSTRISKFLEDVLGYDVFSEISREHVVKERNVDYAIKLNGTVKLFIEVKQAGISLKEKHIEQAENYAANSGVPWVLLTNGIYWQLYHLDFDEGIQSDLVISVDLKDGDIKEAAQMLGILHKKSILKGELETFYEKVQTLSPKSIVQALFHESTLKVIRACLKNSHGIRVDEQEIVENIRKMISKETWETIGDVKITRKRKARLKPKQEERPSSTPATVLAESRSESGESLKD